MSYRGALARLAVVLLGACGAPPDTTVDAAAGTDAATITCTASATCDDGLYCNGPETCAVGVCQGGTPPCAATSCDEAADRCSCAMPDADRDGSASPACGGADCDDADPARFPGNTEICDTTGIDEDCDAATFGNRDTDVDGAIDASCCNHVGGVDRCGTDCNDGVAGIHPLVPEVCNATDDDCDGATDETVLVPYASDCDGDGFGGGTPVVGCTAPVTPPAACPSRPWVTAVGDCDDTDELISPDAVERCNATDDDCNGTVDDAAAAEAACNLHGTGATCTAGVCSAATCTAGYLDCEASAGGCETDPLITPAHCGTCDHACARPSCAAGICTDDFVAIDLGNSTTCGLRRSGAVACWGWNMYGQLGNGTVTNSPTPVAVLGITDATAISVSNASVHACALRAGGTVSCWGSNFGGALGDGTTINRSTPVTVPGITGAVELRTGNGQTCVRRATGEVLCWGHGGAGALGDGLFTTSSTPVMVSGITGALRFDMGGNLGCVIRGDSSLACWGFGLNGELGNGAMTNQGSPVPSATGLSMSRVAAGYDHVCAIDTLGAAYCWGRGDAGQLGDGGTTGSALPRPVAGLPAAPVEIASGSSHTCVIRGPARGVSCWGPNSYGEIGDGTVLDRTSAVAVFGLAGTAQIALGQTHSCALGADGVVRCWGSNIDGELGDGTTVGHSSPVAIVDP